MLEGLFMVFCYFGVVVACYWSLQQDGVGDRDTPGGLLAMMPPSTTRAKAARTKRRRGGEPDAHTELADEEVAPARPPKRRNALRP